MGLCYYLIVFAGARMPCQDQTFVLNSSLSTTALRYCLLQTKIRFCAVKTLKLLLPDLGGCLEARLPLF